MAKVRFQLSKSQVIRTPSGVARRSPESALAGLLKKRAAAQNAGLVDLERQLRSQILASLPICRPAEGPGGEGPTRSQQGTPPLPPAADEGGAASGRREDRPGAPAPRQRAPRHAVVWQGELFWDNRSAPVRLRNVSAEGAMVFGSARLAPGKQVVLALKSAGTIFATVRWSRSGLIGLKFDRRFDIRKLTEPDAAGPAKGAHQGRHGLVKPQYLNSERDPDSPWAARWDRLRPQDLG